VRSAGSGPSAKQASTALRKVADRESLVAGGDQLRALAGDLSSAEPTRIARWVEVDLFSAFDAEILVAAPAHRLQPVQRWLGHVNAVLLVLPLVVTWLGLRSASTGYAGLVAEDPAVAAEPFFALWQDGFGGASEPFGVVVAWMLICLLLLAGGQLAARLLTEHIDADCSERERVTRGALSHALLLASCELSAHRHALPAEVAGQLRDTATTVRESAKETRTLLASLQRSTTKAQRLIDTHLVALEATPDTLDRAIGSLETATTALDTASQSIGATVTQVAAAVAAADAGREELGRTLGAALAAHDDAASARYAVAAAEARKAHDDLVAAIGLLLSQLTDSVGRETEQLTRQVADAQADLARTVDQLTAALQDGHLVQETGAAATQAQISALEELLLRTQELSDQFGSATAEAA
jgi:ABC-type transporter Mla subunit MlaD